MVNSVGGSTEDGGQDIEANTLHHHTALALLLALLLGHLDTGLVVLSTQTQRELKSQLEAGTRITKQRRIR